MNESAGGIAEVAPHRKVKEKVRDTLDVVVNTTRPPLVGPAISLFIEKGLYHFNPDAIPALMGSHTLGEMLFFTADVAFLSVIDNVARGRGLRVGRAHYAERAKTFIGAWKTGNQGLEQLASSRENPTVPETEMLEERVKARDKIKALVSSWRTGNPGQLEQGANRQKSPAIES